MIETIEWILCFLMFSGILIVGGWIIGKCLHEMKGEDE